MEQNDKKTLIKNKTISKTNINKSPLIFKEPQIYIKGLTFRIKTPFYKKKILQ